MLLNCGVGEDSWESLGQQRFNQSILKEISPESSLEGLLLKLKFHYFGHLMRRTESLAKTLILEKLMAGREGDNRGWDVWMASLTWWLWVWASSRSWTGKPGVLQCMGLQRVGHDIATELNWRWNSSCMTAQSQDTGSLLHLELNWNISFWVSVLQHSDWTTSSTLLSNGTSWDLSASITTWSNSFFVINLSIFFSFSS